MFRYDRIKRDFYVESYDRDNTKKTTPMLKDRPNRQIEYHRKENRSHLKRQPVQHTSIKS